MNKSSLNTVKAPIFRGFYLAERQGFEPWDGVNRRRFSRSKFYCRIKRILLFLIDTDIPKRVSLAVMIVDGHDQTDIVLTFFVRKISPRLSQTMCAETLQR